MTEQIQIRKQKRRQPTTSDMTVAEILEQLAYYPYAHFSDAENNKVVSEALAAIEAHYAAGESSERLNNTEEV